MRRTQRQPTYRLRLAVERLPRHTKEAMLRGIESNRIIVGAYVDPRSGGVCPMLAAHRNGGRTSVASFARAWDEYTGAKRPRRATRREVRALRVLLEWSLGVADDLPMGSIAEAAAQIRAEREQFRCATAPDPAAALEAIAGTADADASEPVTPEPAIPDPVEVPDADPARIRVRRRRDTGERHRGRELRLRRDWSWMRPTRRLDEYKDLLAAAEEQLAEQTARESLGSAAERAH